MKKLLLVSFALFLIFRASAQVCTPDSALFPKGTSFGILPDSLVAKADVAYNQTLQFKFPKDTTYSGFSVVIDTVIIDSVTHFPKSLSYECGTKDCEYLGGSYGCALITGTPANSEVGDYNLKIYFTIDFHSLLFGSELHDTVSGKMKLTVDASSGIFDQAVNNRFELHQNYPNPFNQNTEITYNSPSTAPAYLVLRNELGQQVYASQLRAIQGFNTFNFIRNGLPQGMYFYSVQTGDNIITRSMVIKN